MHSRLWKVLSGGVAGLLLLVAAAGTSAGQGTRVRVSAEDDHAAAPPAPPMGWSTWSFIRHNPTEADVEATAQAMHDSGLRAHGFRYVNVDDFYYVCTAGDGPAVDQFGRWVVDTTKFPHGMKAVGDFIHGLGLKFGLYVTPGIPNEALVNNTAIEGTSLHAADIATANAEKNYNCKHMLGIDYNKPGAQAFVDSWARLLASYGVDYLKIDGVGDSDAADVDAWARALRRTGRSIHLELSNSLDVRNGAVWRQLSGGWRISGDIECYSKCVLLPGVPPPAPGSSVPLTDWSHVSSRFGQAPQWTHVGGAGHYNDLDSLEIGNGTDDGLTPDQRQSHMTLWTIAGAPFILGTDLTHLDPADLAMLTNDEVLKVEQAGVPGAPLTYNTPTQVWRARQPDGSYAVALFNTTAASAPVRVSWSDLGVQGAATVRDLWAHADLGSFATGFGATLAADASLLLRVRPATPAAQIVADAPRNTRSGTTTLTCTVCADGIAVGMGGTVTFNGLAGRDGTSTVTIAYVNAGAPTTAKLRVNDEDRLTVSFPSTGTVDALQTVRVPLELERGGRNRLSLAGGPGQLLVFDSITVQAGAPPGPPPPEQTPAASADPGPDSH
jgi:hypothetical protein